LLTTHCLGEMLLRAKAYGYRGKTYGGKEVSGGDYAAIARKTNSRSAPLSPARSGLTLWRTVAVLPSQTCCSRGCRYCWRRAGLWQARRCSWRSSRSSSFDASGADDPREIAQDRNARDAGAGISRLRLRPERNRFSCTLGPRN